MRVPGKSIYLFLGRGRGYEGVWYGEDQIVSSLRKRDQFLEYIRKHLTNTRLDKVSIDSKDRIISFHYIKYAKKHTFALFYSGRRTYFANHFYNLKKEKMELFTSWNKLREVPEGVELNDFFYEVGRSEQEKLRQNTGKEIEVLLKEESLVALKSVKKKKDKRFLKRKEKNILNDLDLMTRDSSVLTFIEQTQDFESLQKEIFINDIKIKFQSSDHFKRRDELYTKIKKMKKAQKILRLRLEDTVKKLNEDESNEVDFSILDPIKVPIKVEQIEKLESKKQGYNIIKQKGYEYAYGLSAQGNDQLRKEWASKTDFWFHLHEEQSSHIILKSDNALDSNIFEEIAKKMLELSSKSTNEVNLVYTQVKNLKGVKGKPGSVTFKKEKYIRVYV